MSTIMYLPDLHYPFAHRDANKFIEFSLNKYNPDRVVCLGDEADFHSISRWPKSLRAVKAKQELRMLRECIAELGELIPVMPICKSNHTKRPEREAAAVGIPDDFLKPIGQLLRAPQGWSWHDEVVIDGVTAEHGDALGSGNFATVIRENMTNTIFGHWHSVFGGVTARTKRGVVWAASPGCLIDEDRYAFEYGIRHKRRPLLGLAIVKDGSFPHLVPMNLKPGKRWDGKVS